jgi:hypothetical protein
VPLITSDLLVPTIVQAWLVTALLAPEADARAKTLSVADNAMAETAIARDFIYR